MSDPFKRLLLVSVLVIGTIRADELSFSAAKAWQRGFERRGDEIVLETTDDKEGAGAGWTLTFNQTVPAPVRISAESCGETLADGILAPAGTSVFSFKPIYGGSLTFGYQLTDGTVEVFVDGVSALTLTASADWTTSAKIPRSIRLRIAL